ncbi:hypothetical protein [Desulfatitalea alkaliphila]|uniref:Uncharacterized protein n=1 Tax=Desulfatitalea alkaliphila TaxID=2929485 RepID=A0AA41R580_9BACT|nr:hypothetical protein [Desulfatitalea alkaliphila]MCJ8503059.1 hypothetical protein [Desulfatitalea alkaliphila]
MKHKEFYTLFSLFVFFLILFGIAKIRVADLREELNYRLRVSAAPLPPSILKALAGEFKGVVADYLLLEAASFLGGNLEPDEREWGMVAHLLEQSSILDPYFKQTYVIAQGILPWHAEKYDETITILERSNRHRYWDWRPGFFIGFNHFYFYKDHSAASAALMEASLVPGAPPTLATWASRLASKVGQYQSAIDFLAGMYESTEDEHQKRLLKKRMTAVQDAYRLQQAVDQFSDQFGRLPHSLDELLDFGLILEIPDNPYNRPYTLSDDGRVDF